jgi:hypothetical protein
MEMRICAYDSAAEFLADTRFCLESQEGQNNLPLGVAARLAARSPWPEAELPLLISMSDNGVIVGAAIMTPKRKLILSCTDGDSAEHQGVGRMNPVTPLVASTPTNPLSTARASLDCTAT